MDTVKALISAGKTEEAIQQLQQATKGTPYEEECILLSNQYERVTAEKMLNVLDDREANLAYNKINRSLLRLIEKIEHSGKAESSPTVRKKVKKSGFLWIAGAIIVLSLVGYFWYASSSKTYYFDFEYENVPVAIINELDSLRKNNETVKDIEIDANYAHVFLLGRNRAMWSNDIPPYLGETLRKLYNENRQVKDVAIGPDSRWVILYARNSYWVYPDVQDTLRKFLDDYGRRNFEIKQVEFGPYRDEWLMVVSWNGYGYSMVPEGLLGSLNANIDGENQELKSVVIGFDNEWVMLLGRNDFVTSEKVEAKLKRELASLQKKDKEIRQVCFLKNGGWIVLTN